MRTPAVGSRNLKLSHGTNCVVKGVSGKRIPTFPPSTPPITALACLCQHTAYLQWLQSTSLVAPLLNNCHCQFMHNAVRIVRMKMCMMNTYVGTRGGGGGRVDGYIWRRRVVSRRNAPSVILTRHLPSCSPSSFCSCDTNFPINWHALHESHIYAWNWTAVVVWVGNAPT